MTFLIEAAMKTPLRPFTVLVCCLLLLGGCQDKHDPVKPTVTAQLQAH